MKGDVPQFPQPSPRTTLKFAPKGGCSETSPFGIPYPRGTFGNTVFISCILLVTFWFVLPFVNDITTCSHSTLFHSAKSSKISFMWHFSVLNHTWRNISYVTGFRDLWTILELLTGKQLSISYNIGTFSHVIEHTEDAKHILAEYSESDWVRDVTLSPILDPFITLPLVLLLSTQTQAIVSLSTAKSWLQKSGHC